MNNLKKINQAIRGTQLVEVFCTATTAAGKTETIKVRVPFSKLNKLQGNGLSSKDLYDLAKKGKCTSSDLWGNSFVYELGAHSSSRDKVQPTNPPERLAGMEIKENK